MSNFDGKKCVIYTRVSSKTQIQQGNWLQSQENVSLMEGFLVNLILEKV